MVVLEGSQEAKKVDFFLRWKRKKFTSHIAGQHSAVTATTGNGALRTWRGLKKASPRRTSHAEESHRDDHLAVWTIYFKILAFNLNKTKAVWDSLFCLLSNEHQHDNYIKVDWFKKSTLINLLKYLQNSFRQGLMHQGLNVITYKAWRMDTPICKEHCLCRCGISLWRLLSFRHWSSFICHVCSALWILNVKFSY